VTEQSPWILLSRHVSRGLRAGASPRFHAALLLGLGAWLLPDPEIAPSLAFLGLSALVEELVFRLLLQGEMHRLLGKASPLPGLSLANAATSGVFAAVHLVNHPPLWALSVFFPSLVFGWARDRYRSVLPPIVLHLGYNILYFYRL